jgi:hypothetical protein
MSEVIIVGYQCYPLRRKCIEYPSLKSLYEVRLLNNMAGEKNRVYFQNLTN